jgi:hypothetical protein
MILPQVLALSAQLIVLVAAGDRMPELNVEPTAGIIIRLNCTASIVT